jgi:hypothetical protein
MRNVNYAEKKEGHWISLIEYASKKAMSVATLKRHIQDHRVQSKMEEGRYFIYDPEENPPFSQKKVLVEQSQEAFLEKELERLTFELKKAQQQIVELKTLVAFYEESIAQKSFYQA